LDAALVKTFAWNEEKNQQLKVERGVSFEYVLACLAAGDLLDIVEHPHPEKYAGQRSNCSGCHFEERFLRREISGMPTLRFLATLEMTVG